MLFKNKSRRIFFIVISFFLLTLQCKKEEITDDTYFGGKIIILGHRGMGVLYSKPGNTYESIYSAIGIGADGCEIDIQLTKDTVLVLFHDNLLSPVTTCSSRIYEMTWAEVKECKYYALENMIFVNSLDELFAKLPNLTNLYFSFDCKLDFKVENFELYQSQYLRAIKRLCEKYDMSNNVFLESGELFLNTAQKLGLKNKLFLASYLDSASIEAACNNNFSGISSPIGKLEGNAGFAHEKGLYIMGYSPDNYDQNMEAVNSKSDILQTDDPISILKFFGRYNYEYVIP